jgi:hypothetical protein
MRGERGERRRVDLRGAPSRVIIALLSRRREGREDRSERKDKNRLGLEDWVGIFFEWKRGGSGAHAAEKRGCVGLGFRLSRIVLKAGRTSIGFLRIEFNEHKEF